MKINTTEEQGKQGVKSLIELTQEKKKPYYKVIEEEVLRGIFEE